MSSCPHVWLCQFDRLPLGNLRRVVRILVASDAVGVPPMKLLPWPATQMGAAMAIKAIRSFKRDSPCFSRGMQPSVVRLFLRFQAGSVLIVVRQGVTLTVTLSYVNKEPSLATARSTYVPGS